MWNHILSMWNHILCGQLTFEFPVASNRIFAHELHEWETSHRDHKYVAWWYWEVHHINNTLNLQSSWVCQSSLFSSQKFVVRSETLPSLLLCPPLPPLSNTLFSQGIPSTAWFWRDYFLLFYCFWLFITAHYNVINLAAVMTVFNTCFIQQAHSLFLP